MDEAICTCEYADDEDSGETFLVLCKYHYANFVESMKREQMRQNAWLN